MDKLPGDIEEEYIRIKEEYIKDLSYFYNQTEEEAEQHYKKIDYDKGN